MRIQGVASERQRNVNVFSKTKENNVPVHAKNVTFFPFLASRFYLQRTPRPRNAVFGKVSDPFCAPARAFAPHRPKKRCVRRARKTPSMTSPVTASHAVTPIGGVSGVTHTEQTRPRNAVLLARQACSQDPCGWEDLPGRTFAAFPSGEVVRVPGQRADACASCPVWGDDDAPPLTGLSPASHKPTRVRCPAGQQRHPQGQLDPCLFQLPLPGHRTVGARSRQQGRRHEQSTLSCNHDRQATSVTAASLLAGERWRWEQALARSTARAEAPQPEPVDVSSQAEPAGTLPQFPDVVANVLGEPDGIIGPHRDAKRRAVGRRGRELGDGACRGDAPDLVATVLGEPEGIIGPRRDAKRLAAPRRERELGDVAGERQGEAMLFHTDTVPFCLARPRPDGRSKRDLPHKRSNARGVPGTALR